MHKTLYVNGGMGDDRLETTYLYLFARTTNYHHRCGGDKMCGGLVVLELLFLFLHAIELTLLAPD